MDILVESGALTDIADGIAYIEAQSTVRGDDDGNKSCNDQQPCPTGPSVVSVPADRDVSRDAS